MAKSKSLDNGEWSHFDPSIAGGPWTFTAPDTELDGAEFTLIDDSSSPPDSTNVTVQRAGSTATIQDPDTPGTFASSITFNFNGISRTAVGWRYNAGKDKWYLRPGV